MVLGRKGTAVFLFFFFFKLYFYYDSLQHPALARFPNPSVTSKHVRGLLDSLQQQGDQPGKPLVAYTEPFEALFELRQFYLRPNPERQARAARSPYTGYRILLRSG